MDIKNYFNKKNKKNAVIFVNYEYWNITSQKSFYVKPDISEWYIEILNNYNIVELLLFGDFTEWLKDDIETIKSYTEQIIDTHNQYGKKNITDFIMLDHIYQKIYSAPKAGTFILFSGNGQFNSAINFLRNEYKKNVVVYGISGTVSRSLLKSANECIEIKYTVPVFNRCIKLIIKNFDYIYKQPIGKIRPTFFTTVEVITRDNDVDRTDVESALTYLIENGYITQKTERINFNTPIQVLRAEWDLIINDGLWKVYDEN